MSFKFFLGIFPLLLPSVGIASHEHLQLISSHPRCARQLVEEMDTRLLGGVSQEDTLSTLILKARDYADHMFALVTQLKEVRLNTVPHSGSRLGGSPLRFLQLIFQAHDGNPQYRQAIYGPLIETVFKGELERARVEAASSENVPAASSEQNALSRYSWRRPEATAIAEEATLPASSATLAKRTLQKLEDLTELSRHLSFLSKYVENWLLACQEIDELDLNSVVILKMGVLQNHSAPQAWKKSLEKIAAEASKKMEKYTGLQPVARVRDSEEGIAALSQEEIDTLPRLAADTYGFIRGAILTLPIKGRFLQNHLAVLHKRIQEFSRP